MTKTATTQKGSASALPRPEELALLPLDQLPPDMADVIKMVEGRADVDDGPEAWQVPSTIEEDLLSWLQHGKVPEHPVSSPDDVEDWLSPIFGGTLEGLNRERLAWWIAFKRLQERLKEFIALEIPVPEEITAEQVASWQE